MPTTDQSLLKRIQAFCLAREISETAFGRQSIGDPNLLTQLRAGRSLTGRTIDKIEQFMREYRG